MINNKQSVITPETHCEVPKDKQEQQVTTLLIDKMDKSTYFKYSK